MNIYDLTFEQMVKFLSEYGDKKSRAEAIFHSLYADCVEKISDIDVNPKTIDILKKNFELNMPECVSEVCGENAVKYLFKLSDGNLIESVLMRHEYGDSVCVSTQAGCNMDCAFCRSGRMKKIRDLTSGEILGQIIYIKKKIGNIKGIAVMGIGEPFDNYENVISFIDTALYQKGLCIGPKHITVSTCGLVPKIEALEKSKYNINLAVSLHAPNDELRSELMPINRRYPLDVLIPAVKHFSVTTNRRVTLEYVMLKGVNDTTKCAEQLAALIADTKCYINIIRYNPSDGDKFECSDFEQIMRFYDVLKKNGVQVTMRRKMGVGVNAGCGQLRGETMDNNQKKH